MTESGIVACSAFYFQGVSWFLCTISFSWQFCYNIFRFPPGKMCKSLANSFSSFHLVCILVDYEIASAIVITRGLPNASEKIEQPLN